MSTLKKIKVLSTSVKCIEFQSIDSNWGELQRKINSEYEGQGMQSPLDVPNHVVNLVFSTGERVTGPHDEQEITSDVKVHITVDKVNSGC